MYQAEQYSYHLRRSEEDQCFIAHVAEFSLDAAHGDSPEEALREAIFVIRESLLLLAEQNKPIPEPSCVREFSGKILVRVPPSLHRNLSMEAKQEGVSVNQLINLKLNQPLYPHLQQNKQ